MAVDTQALGAIEVERLDGSIERLGSAWSEGPAVLVFLRHFG